MLRGFRTFMEDDKYVSTIKKQLGVPKKLWLGMPVLVTNTKIGKHKIDTPTMFNVTDFDEKSVTVATVANTGVEDLDDEIDTDKIGEIEITISRDDFYKLIEPQVPPGADTGGMMGGLGGGML